MQVLEKILEEIERTRKSIIDMSDEEPELVDVEDWFDEGVDQGKLIAYEVVKEIIRSHMDEAKDINVPSKDGWIDRKNLEEEIKSLRFMITGMRNGKTMTRLALEGYRKSILKIIDEQPTYMDDGWIPVEERLPEVPEGIEDDCCPEFNVTIRGADKATTLKCASDGTWFDDSGEVYKVIAWQPLPGPYRPKEKNNE